MMNTQDIRNIDREIIDLKKEGKLKAWICEYLADYEEYARALKQCDYTLQEIVDDLSAVTDDNEIVRIIKEVY